MSAAGTIFRVFHGRIIDLSVEPVQLPNGHTADLEIVRHPGGAAVVAVNESGQICLLRQYRYAAGGWLWELPAGKLEPDEEAVVTAARELEEEAGVRAKALAPLGVSFSSPGVLTEVVHLFLATEVEPVAAATEDHEVIEVHWMPLEDAMAMARDGRIIDSKTLAGLLRAEAVLGQR